MGYGHGLKSVYDGTLAGQPSVLGCRRVDDGTKLLNQDALVSRQIVTLSVESEREVVKHHVTAGRVRARGNVKEPGRIVIVREGGIYSFQR